MVIRRDALLTCRQAVPACSIPGGQGGTPYTEQRYALMARMIDKGRADLQETVDEHHYASFDSLYIQIVIMRDQC
jgi:hypothetical protein